MRLAAEPYQPCFDGCHTGAVSVYHAESVWTPAIPAGKSEMYATLPVPTAVQLEAFGVILPSARKKAFAISIADPDAISDCAEVTNCVKEMAA